ncbi:hypothetical protein M6I34_02240 [Burkholderiaceae bacterium FT117]|uniref:hypothetical protein n=1 Tax=Zeimonas sediminis TaxID=2944268 RepID=UPI0023431B6E|nr:hypothetical protein [Zeimonas sediminis]MCM5569320.1 hypothetical protein [Zeimonas sediminis]
MPLHEALSRPHRAAMSLAREMRLSYLPPLMVYMAAGISGLTAIVGTFFVKEYLGLSAEFLAALGFWAGLPWALKMPLGHLVDLIWRWKGWLVLAGASLIAVELVVMIGLLADPAAMGSVMPVEAWYVLAVLLSPIGYVMQDCVADAMTVEAVPHRDPAGVPYDADRLKGMHTTMQTLGRVAIIGGGMLVALLNVGVLGGVGELPEAERVRVYVLLHEIALAIPAISVSGVVFAWWLRRRERSKLIAGGLAPAEADARLAVQVERPPVNWWVLGGGAGFAALSLTVGLGHFRWAQETVFAVSMAIVLTLMWRLTRELAPHARQTLLGTAIVIFVFRALPTPGAGQTWWMIDVLKFDQQFLAILSLIASALTLAGLFVFRRFMAEASIYRIVAILTVVGALLAAPIIGMYYGLHEWTAARTGGIVNAHFIALVDTALESPLGQIAMVPMLAWIANSAPEKLKATFFAVMASFTNLALSASQLGTKYLNEAFVVTREVRNTATGVVTVPADYSQLGDLMLLTVALALVLPFVAIALVKLAGLKSG